MELKGLEESSIKARDSYNKARSACVRLTGDAAIARFKEVVQNFPDLAPAREKLRALELAKLKNMTGWGRFVANMKTSMMLGKITAMVSADPVRAMSLCEDLLALNLENPKVLDQLARAGLIADAPFVAVEALGLLRRFDPKYPKLAERLEHARNRAERDSGGKKRDETNEAVIQQLIDGSVHDAGQAGILIERFQKELHANDSIDVRKRLAEAYMIAGRYEEAHTAFREVAERMGAMDPVIDKAIERAYIAQIDESLNILRANPAAYENGEEQIADLEQHRAAYCLRKAQERCKMYPKDAMLHYELGELYFEAGRYQEAMEEFRMSGRSLRREAESRFYIGRCLYLTDDKERGLKVMDEYVKNLEAGRVRLTFQYALADYHLAEGNAARWLELMREIVLLSPRFQDAAARVRAYEEEHPETVVIEEVKKDENDDIF
ncbi:MAG: hypothetical protein IJC73_04335 [Lentisphaeria bacterium]|nr:hypothetical protein [Lentisphaeria bacterium]